VTYNIRFDKSAARDLDRMNKEMLKRVKQALERIKSNPRPPGCVKLEDIDNAWRVRVVTSA